MKRILTAIAVLALVFPCAALAQAKPKAAGDDTEKALTQIEQQMADAIVKMDLATIDKHAGPTFVFIAPDGGIQDRAQWMADLKAGNLKIQSTKNDEMKVRAYGNTAVVTYRSTDKGTYKDKDISGQYRWTDVFVKEGGAWKLVSTQGTGLPPAKTPGTGSTLMKK